MPQGVPPRPRVRGLLTARASPRRNPDQRKGPANRPGLSALRPEAAEKLVLRLDASLESVNHRFVILDAMLSASRRDRERETQTLVLDEAHNFARRVPDSG
jgi:hypothetical protein